MQYEDSSGCWWTEHKSDEGFAFYFNENTQESAWELPACAREIAEEGAALAPCNDTSCHWIVVADADTPGEYFYNTVTKESKWTLNKHEELASGLSHDEEMDREWDAYDDTEAGSSSLWQNKVLNDFHVPGTVSEAVGRAGSAQIWPQTVDGRTSRLVRWDVLKADDPYRELFGTGEGCRKQHPEFEPKLCFYAFDAAVELVERYWVEDAEAPFRCRLQRAGLKFSRDISHWEKRSIAPAGAPNGQNDEGGAKDNFSAGREHIHADGNKGGAGNGFFAFPLVVHSSHAHHVDWTSGPDRYQISRAVEAEWGWTRLFTFFGYAASKYHVLETSEKPLAQKIIKGHLLTPERGWKCVLAFYAFDDPVPGSNKYYVEEKQEPHLRTRIGMEPSCRWDSRYTFAAFDVPVPGSCALDVHYTLRSADSLRPYPEQCRISLKDPWGLWEQKFRFYAFPAEHVGLAPAQEDVDARSASLAGTMPATDIS